MLTHLKSALKSASLAAIPNDAEIASWLAASPSLPADVREEFARRGSPFATVPSGRKASVSETEMVAAMNRANADDKMSQKTQTELARLRREKLVE